MKKKRSLWIIKFISISLGISGGFFLFEIFARIIPSTDIFLLELPLYCDNPKSPKYSCIFRREKFINGRFIRGKLPPFPIDVKKSTNDIGQFSNINFKDLKNNDKSILKILSIGDSFVEAMQVSNENTFHGLLNQSKTIDNKKVVSSAIGTAGNAFPQYLVHLYYANEKINLNSTLLIIPIIANDFDESFNKYNSKYAGAKFSISNKEKIFYTSRINNTKTRFKRFLVKNSYMTRYLLLNIKLTEYLTRSPFCFLNQTSPCDDNLITEDESNKEKYLLTDSILATDIFLNNLNELRKTTQPISLKTSGSTFKNPPKLKAWKLIKDSGCSNLRIGDAKVSSLHCNFIENKGLANAQDIEELGKTIISKVKKNFGIKLTWEIKIIGSKKKYRRLFNG